MKTLMTFSLFNGELYAKTKPEASAFSDFGCQQSTPVDWREDLRRYADSNGWELKETDLESVESMLDFMIANSPSFCKCIRRSDVQLPGGVVLLDSTAGGEQGPIMLFWEEEIDG